MFKKLTALVLVIGCATIYAQNYYSYSPQRGNVTRTDLTPNDLLKKNNTESSTTIGSCQGVNGGIVGGKACVDEKGTISASANIYGGQFTIYYNPETKNMGGCVGVGTGLEAGPVGVSGSAQVCGDKEKGLITKTSVNVGSAQFTTTYTEKDDK